MDNSKVHRSEGLKVPEGIEIEYLPPFCPELNPFEGEFE